MARALHTISQEIIKDWGMKMSPHAKPYVNAMRYLVSIEGQYGADSAQSVVLYFLSNASAWRGDVAKRVKEELKQMLRDNGYKIK